MVREAATRGFLVSEWSSDSGNRDLLNPRRLIRNAPYVSIYGHDARSEFLLVDEVAGREVRIECRWQQVQGSVDEKMPYLYHSAVDAMPEREIVFLIGGGGARPSSVKWLRDNCSKHIRKTILVVNEAEFRAWMRDFARLAA